MMFILGANDSWRLPRCPIGQDELRVPVSRNAQRVGSLPAPQTDGDTKSSIGSTSRLTSGAARADAEHHVPEFGDQKPVAGMVSFLEMIAVDPDGLARAHAEAERAKGVGVMV
jgi:hypothetical protein